MTCNRVYYYDIVQDAPPMVGISKQAGKLTTIVGFTADFQQADVEVTRVELKTRLGGSYARVYHPIILEMMQQWADSNLETLLEFARDRDAEYAEHNG